MTVAGNIDHREVIDLVEKATRDWQPRKPLDWEPASDGVRGPVVKVEQRRTDQTHVCIALPGLSLNDPNRYDLAMLNVIFGDGMSSRLFLNLREDQGLTYDVNSTIQNFRDCGSLGVYCGVEPKKTRKAIQGVMHEMKGLHQEPGEKELNKAKEYAKGRLLLRMEDTRAVTGWLAIQEMLQGKVSTPEEVVQLIDAVTPGDVARVAQNVFDPDKLRLAVVGPHRSENMFLKVLQF